MPLGCVKPMDYWEQIWDKGGRQRCGNCGRPIYRDSSSGYWMHCGGFETGLMPDGVNGYRCEPWMWDAHDPRPKTTAFPVRVPFVPAELPVTAEAILNAKEPTVERDETVNVTLAPAFEDLDEKMQKRLTYQAREYVDSVADVMRTFDTGATRNNDEGRIDPEGFISPHVLLRFSEYMNRNRHTADGGYRESDNWQKGLPRGAYMKSLVRHLLELWAYERRDGASDPFVTEEQESKAADTLCAIIFNAQGMLFEILREHDRRGRSV